jgi:hypothetical protein
MECVNIKMNKNKVASDEFDNGQIYNLANGKQSSVIRYSELPRCECGHLYIPQINNMHVGRCNADYHHHTYMNFKNNLKVIDYEIDGFKFSSKFSIYDYEFERYDGDDEFETYTNEINESEINKIEPLKIKCVCGSSLTPKGKYKHVKSLKHINYIKTTGKTI